ncbi:MULTISPECIES: NAD(P)-dependent oxidoreductase [Pandoraea]|uniref:NAD(P)-dependent oxidoreductase n=1 Tax=Pandoraea TaxID=93217 RepID=UPI001F5CE0B7|nr:MULTISPECIES: NAD(P)-dependent oxidoreductase [Pandoraea]MCI3206397.1 2-hydroxy-3-oxopropionate reductase [Pandoraea sp. LA3]MDN4584425.1 2-hydroxy-3-oxopropionate reductase [Pandoraea capi]
MQIAFLGTGLMGAHQVRRLLGAGHDVRVWNRTLDKALPLATDGAFVAAGPAEAARGADVLIAMLENGDVVEQLLFGDGVAEALKPGAIVIDTSSIKPSQARDHAQRLMGMGLRYLDAPVSGGVVAAQAGTLAIMVGGDAVDVEALHLVFEPMGRATHVGPHGCGQLAKLANQMIVAVNIAAVAEALQLAARGGANAGNVVRAIRGGLAESRVLELYGTRMVDGDFSPRARATMQLKDLRNAMEVAAQHDFSAPTAQTVTGLFHELVARSGEVDHCGLWLEIARLNQPSMTHFTAVQDS